MIFFFMINAIHDLILVRIFVLHFFELFPQINEIRNMNLNFKKVENIFGCPIIHTKD